MNTNLLLKGVLTPFIMLLFSLVCLGQLNVSISTTAPSCAGFTDGSAIATANGGSGSYTYQWSNGVSGQRVTGLAAGSISVTVTDNTGSTGTRSTTIVSPSPILGSFTQSGVQCARTDGLSVAITGGTAPYSYLWDNGQTTSSASGLGFRTACVDVTDAAGCTVRLCEDVRRPLTVTLTTQDVLCPGGCDAVVIASVTGGVQPVTYLWDNGTTDAINDMLLPGTYCVTVTDAEGCPVTECATVGQPDPFTFNFNTTNPNCGATNGAVTVAAGGGTGPYTYVWDNGTSGPTRTGLGEGTYTVNVTDANGCTGSESVTLAGSNLSVSIAATSPACGAGNTGSAVANVSGGTAPFTYSWTNGSTNNSAGNLSPGMYSVTVTDANGCVGTANTTITAGSSLTVTAVATAELCTGDANGSISAMVTGGTAPYTFSWNNGSIDPTIDNLAPGTYQVMVTDAAGCAGAATATVTSPTALQCSVTVLNAVTSTTISDGQVTAQFSGGVMPYTISWNTGATQQTISNLGAGTYTATITDSNGCTTTCSTTLTAPVVGLGKIGDFVFRDLDRDGQQDLGEPGVRGVRVTLIFPDGTRSPFMTTGADGMYCFGDLAPGDYQVEFEIKIGDDVFTLSDTGNDDTDSDAVVTDKPQIGTSGIITIMGDTILTVDAGVFDPCVTVNPGTITASTPMVCGVGADPGIINSTVPATSTGAIRYLWMFNNTNDPNFANWTPAPGVNNLASYDPGPIQNNTYFARCAFGVDCSVPVETNVVLITTGTDARAEIDGPLSVCVGDNYTFRAVSPGAGASISWDFGPSSTPSTSTRSTESVSWSTFGQRNVQLTVVANGCTTTASQRVAISNCITPRPFPVSTRMTMGNTVELDWAMEDELESGIYRVDRSVDGGATFQQIGEVAVQLGSLRQAYAYTDSAPKRGFNVYRVCRVLELGDTYFSDQASASFAEPEVEMLAYPNPVVDFVTIERLQNIDVNSEVELVDQSGRVLRSYNFAAGERYLEIQLRSAPVGQLVLRMVSPNGYVGSLSILRQ